MRKITLEEIKLKGACSYGVKYFIDNFKDEVSVEELLKKLYEEKENSYLSWVINNNELDNKDFKLINNGKNNVGYSNTGDWNTGYNNTGSRNTGDSNTGSRNTGDSNTGNRNTGDWNRTNYSTGFFNTEEKNIIAFNKQTSINRSDYIELISKTKIYSMGILINVWVSESEMSDQEKIDNPDFYNKDGYLKCLTQEEISKKRQFIWDKLSENEKENIYKLPNFDKEIFEEIMMIKII
ncbi:MAG: pentapeptide repeat-containing protein [Fusobacteriaceae bacterium]